MRMNPIVKKDIKVQARSMRISWGIFVYVAIMALVFFFCMFVIQQNNIYSNSNIYSDIIDLYPTLGVTQLIILGVVVPVRTASAISGEKERQTFDIMMTTSMTPFSIVMGKVMTAIMQGLFYVLAGMPIMALAFVIGGLSWSYLFWFFAIAVLVSFFSASIGIFCSSVCKRSISAVIMSYGFYMVFFALTAIPYLIVQLIGVTGIGNTLACWLYLINPAIFLSEFFSWVMSGDSVIYYVMTPGMQGGLTMPVIHHMWIILSAVMFVAISFLFLGIAAKRISPISKGKAKKLAARQMAARSNPAMQNPYDRGNHKQ